MKGHEPKVPSAKEIEQLVAEVKAIEGKIIAYTILLDKDSRLATTKSRKGGEQVVDTIADLAMATASRSRGSPRPT